MPAFLLKLIPFRDYAYAAVAVAAVGFWFYHDHIEQQEGAARVTTAVAAATAKANAAAQATIDKYTGEYSSSTLAIEDAYEQRIKANSSAHDLDVQRLQQRASGSGHTSEVLRGAASTGGSASPEGAASPVGLGSVSAAEALKLVDALRADDSALTACYADRDSLTGK